MIVTVFGLGFVGLTTSLGLAHLGHTVYGIEADSRRLETLRTGILPFYEPHLDEELNIQRKQGRFILDGSIEQAVKNSEIIFYCVGTPYGEDGAADLTALFEAVAQTLEAIHDDSFRVLVTKSTIPPSTTERCVLPFVKEHLSHRTNLCVANNPEFLREGYCWKDFMEADRIVIGCTDETGRRKLTELYKPLKKPIYCVSPSTGEFVKYLSNTLLATLISYSNEMAQAAEIIGGIQIAQAFRILHMDKRWKNGEMASYAYPGCGYGGYCLPKDTCAFRAQARKFGFEPAVLNAVIETNEHRSEKIAKWIVRDLDKAKSIGIAGLAFKPDSDDVRDSPARRIIEQLQGMGFRRILVYDPIAMRQFQQSAPDLDVIYCESLEELCSRSERIAITTAWPEFALLMQWTGGQVVDCRYMLWGNGHD